MMLDIKLKVVLFIKTHFIIRKIVRRSHAIIKVFLIRVLPKFRSPVGLSRAFA